MSDNKSLTVCLLPDGNEKEALAAADRLGTVVSDVPGEALSLIFSASGVSLSGYALTFTGDFKRMYKRISGGRLSHEMLVKATKTKEHDPTAIDATAGMGEDSILLAAAGYDVIMFEKDPVISILLRDALKRAKDDPDLYDTVSRMHLVEGDSITGMKDYPNRDLIFLDPMFPERKKSGLVNKKLQLIKHIERPCPDEEELLSAAFSANPKKIVIKRPLKGPFLAERRPQYSLTGKAIRYDCFVLK